MKAATVDTWIELLNDGYFDKHPQYKDRQCRIPERLVEFAESIAPIDAAMEIGVGVGSSGRWIRPLCKRLVGCDLSPQNEQELADLGIDLVVVSGDPNGLPGLAAEFDLVYSIYVLQHMPVDDAVETIVEASTRGKRTWHMMLVGEHGKHVRSEPEPGYTVDPDDLERALVDRVPNLEVSPSGDRHVVVTTRMDL